MVVDKTSGNFGIFYEMYIGIDAYGRLNLDVRKSFPIFAKCSLSEFLHLGSHNWEPSLR